MLAVIVCNACTVAMLVGLLGGMAAALFQARDKIATALIADPLVAAAATVTPPAAALRYAAPPVGRALGWSPA